MTKQTLDLSKSFRLSPQQRLRWLTDLPAPTLVLDIRTQLTQQQYLEQLRTVLQLQIDNHEPLRMQLQQASGLKVPVQTVVDSELASNLCIIRRSPADDYSLKNEAGIEGTITTLGNNYYRLKLTLPPLSADRGTLLRLAHCLAADAKATLDEEAMTYSQYTAWLYELQTDEDAEEGLRYWSEIHNDSDTADGLSAEIIYQQGESHNTLTPSIEAKTIDISQKHREAIEQYCDINEYQPSEVLMTAWGILLQRLSTSVSSNQSSIILNWVHDCRDEYDELESCWGLFSKALPLSWQPLSENSFCDSLKCLQQAQEAASEWQEYFAIDTEPTSELLRFGFEWCSEHIMASSPSTEIDVLSIQSQSQPFELLLSVEQLAKVYRLQLNYDTNGYSEQTAVTLLEQFQSLLLDAINAPSKPLENLSMSSGTTNALISQQETNLAATEFSCNELLPTKFRSVALQYPTKIALFESINNDSKSFSYQELDCLSNQLAHALVAKGIGPESRVALYLNRSTTMVLAMLAVLKSGAAFLPIEIQQPESRTLAILDAASPDIILSAAGEQTPPTHLTSPCFAFDSKSLTSFPENLPDITIHPENTAYMLFTSGSTGTPKGVAVAHRQLHNYVNSILNRIPLAPGEKSAVVTSLAADLSYTLLFPALLSGGQLHIIQRDIAMDPLSWESYQTHHLIDHIKAVPSLLEAWLNHQNPASILPQKQLILGGEACKPKLLHTIRQHAPKLTIYNHYGPTETTVGVMLHKTNPAKAYKQLPLSECFDNTNIYLLDQNFQRVAPGLPGELYIAGDNIARGYLNTQQTAERFIPNPFSSDGKRLYRTGDLARYRPNGWIEIIGRVDRQIKIRGFRIELDEIEILLTQLPEVHQAAVICLYKKNGSQQLFAFASLKSNQSVSVAHIHGQLQDRLPDYMLPTLRLVDTLPFLASGKIDRQTLNEHARTMLTHICTAPPRTPLEELLSEMWADVLGLEKVGINDDFFALGGHSLAAVKLASRLQKLLSAPITVNAVFSAPTVEKFIDLMQNDLVLSPLVNLSSTRSTLTKPTLFCFHPSTGHVQDYRDISYMLDDWQVWGLQAGYLTEKNTVTTIQTLASEYVTIIRQQQSVGPYHLLGWSLGGLTALEAAAQLEHAGEEVVFVGIVDSQLITEPLGNDVEQLLKNAIAELDAESQNRIGELDTTHRENLITQLNSHEQHEWLSILSRWAKQQGLQLQGQSWQHIEARLQHQQQTQQLISSFKPPQLYCPLQIWWASDTLANATPVATPPVDWQKLTNNRTGVNIIESNHMDILKQTLWQQQFKTYLSNAKKKMIDPNRQSTIFGEII